MRFKSTHGTAPLSNNKNRGFNSVSMFRKDVTLSELGRLISSAFPAVSRPNTRIAFRLLYTDSFRPRVLLKDVGTVLMSGEQQQSASGNEDAGARTLEDVKYVIGDWIDVAIFNNSQGPRGFDGPRGEFDGGSRGRGGYSRGGGPDRGRGRGGVDSYRGRGRGGGRNGFDAGAGGSGSGAGDGDDRGPSGGPRRDRDRDRDRDRGGRW